MPPPDNLPMSSFSFARLSVQERALLLKLTQNPRCAFRHALERSKSLDIGSPLPRGSDWRTFFSARSGESILGLTGQLSWQDHSQFCA